MQKVLLQPDKPASLLFWMTCCASCCFMFRSCSLRFISSSTCMCSGPSCDVSSPAVNSCRLHNNNIFTTTITTTTTTTTISTCRTPGATVPSSWPGPEGRLARKKIQRRLSTPLGLPQTNRGGDPPNRKWEKEREHMQCTVVWRQLARCEFLQTFTTQQRRHTFWSTAILCPVN